MRCNRRRVMNGEYRRFRRFVRWFKIYILEMICDWWAFSWKSENLYEIFDWYDKHKANIKLSDKTRKAVEDILAKIHSKLDEQSTEDK